MNGVPKVYIIILNFNSCMDTIACVRSLGKISYANYNIVIVDNNSSDDSVYQISANCPGHKLIRSEENLGYAHGNNIGIKYALEQGAEYICILNNDVIVEENFLEPLIERFNSNSSIGITGPCICEFNDKNIIQAMGAYINLYRGLAMGLNEGKQYNNVSREAAEVDYLGGACFVVKSKLFSEIGLIPENYFLFYEETEFCLVARKRGYKLICVHESKVYHKRSATISKFKGLSYYFLNRNRIIFMRRNASSIQKVIFFFYILFEGVGRILIRKEPLKLFRFFIDGLLADKESIDRIQIENYIKI